MYVVGCLGHDKELGRTFVCEDMENVGWALSHITSENQEPRETIISIIKDILSNGMSTSDGKQGTYFVGSLERV